MRAWIAASSSVAGVVTIASVSSRSPVGDRQHSQMPPSTVGDPSERARACGIFRSSSFFHPYQQSTATRQRRLWNAAWNIPDVATVRSAR